MNEPTITKRQLQDVLNRSLGCESTSEMVMSVAFPPPEPRTFYIALNEAGNPFDSSAVSFCVCSTDTLIEVVEVIK